MKLRIDQIDFLKNQIIDNLRMGEKALLAQSCTGYGKTIVAMHLAHHMLERWGFNILFCVHKRDIFLQTVEKMVKFGKYPLHFICSDQDRQDAYRIMSEAGRFNGLSLSQNDNAVVVAMIPTLVRRHANNLEGLFAHLWGHDRKGVFTIIDEAHHVAAATWLKLFSDILHQEGKKNLITGFTATPERGDGGGLALGKGGIFTKLVMGLPMLDCVKKGILCPIRIIAPPNSVRREDIRRKNKDFDDKDSKRKMDEIQGALIEHYQKYLGSAKKTLGFYVSIKHCEDIADSFNAAGIPTRAIHGELDIWERRRIMKEYEAGEIKHLTSCDLLGEGVDFPAVDGVQDACPTLSRVKLFQHLGRGMRMAAGKGKTTILDHAGNTLPDAFGHPYLPVNWNFYGKHFRKETQEREKSSPRAVYCPKCLSCNLPTERYCTECGTLLQFNNSPDIRVNENVELQEHSFGDDAFMHAYNDVWKCKNEDDIEHMAAKYGLTSDWVRNIIPLWRDFSDGVNLFNHKYINHGENSQ